MDIAQTIEAKYLALADRLDEATLRLWIATEARSIGRGGVSVVAKAAGVSRTTVYAGLAELDRGTARGSEAPALDKRRVRAHGGGRKTLASADATLLRDLDALVEPTTRGDPQSA
ncbi:MAG TPA: ISAzo13 family transposase, partial [Caldimonas sp.]